MELRFFSEWNSAGDDNAAGSLFSPFVDFDSEVADALIGFLAPEYSPTLTFDHLFSSPSPPPPPPLSWTASVERVRQSISPQSVAARERRKKISAKTQELGRLIPRGEKMSTADMLVAAHKYVRFLQAQESLLQYMNDQKGFSWYCRQLRVDDDGDVADEFLDEVLSPMSFGEQDQAARSRFEVKYATKPALIKRQAITINGNVHPCMEYHGMLLWV